MNQPVIIGDATLHHGDCYPLLEKIAGVDALFTDPPYGIGYTVNARCWNNEGLDALKPWKMEKRVPIKGDDRPFDPAAFMEFPKVALCGASHFSSRLPDSGRWVCWDKRRDSKPDCHSDFEMVWISLPGADRMHRQKWRGIIREGEENCSRSRKLHPNQKPVALLTFVLEGLGLEAGATVLDPFMGSGSVGVAALRMGFRYIGIEIEPKYFDIACKRLRAEIRMEP